MTVTAPRVSARQSSDLSFRAELDAGFSRWWGDSIAKILGDGFWPDWTALYVGDVVLIALVGTYDFLTRRRLYPAFVLGSLFGLSVQLIAVRLYVSPWWKPLATRLLGH
ncbi:MAG TPA: hypothetical protein VHX61_11785 [Rhizomicrobium sp.]|jgi:hypothetical protein|nr:hypothetical protein [Rhizomicrobium sp.]